MLKRCRTCTSWEVQNESWRESPGSTGVCTRCNSSNGYTDDPTSSARAKDTEDFRAWLETDGGFSCSMYHRKGDQNDGR